MTQRAVGRKGWGTRDTDVLVAVSAADTTPDYLNPKIAVAGGLTKAIINPGANEQLQITGAGGSGTVGRIPKWTAATTLGDSIIYEDTNRIGIGITPAQKFEIGSTDNSDRISIYHDNSDAHFKTNDGVFKFTTTETGNKFGIIELTGSGTGVGIIKLFDEDNAEELFLGCSGGRGLININGAAPGSVDMQTTGNGNVTCFLESASGTVRDFVIYGYRALDALRAVTINVGSAAANCTDITGTALFRINGNLGVGVVPNANALLHLNTPTENFEIIDAGSVGATQQDWVEVECNGAQGYLHVFAAK